MILETKIKEIKKKKNFFLGENKKKIFFLDLIVKLIKKNKIEKKETCKYKPYKRDKFSIKIVIFGKRACGEYR